MTAQASPAIITAIEQLELEARTCETQAGELQDRARACRDLATQIRQTFQISVLAPAAGVPASPARTTWQGTEAWREQMKAEGRCARCGAALAPTSTTLCQKHLDLASNRRLKSERKSMGLNPKVPGGPGPTPRPRPTLEPAACPDIPEKEYPPQGPSVPPAPRRSGPPKAISDEDVIGVLRSATRPLRGLEVWNSLPATRPAFDFFRHQLGDLVRRGRVVRSGQTASTRYALPTATPAPAPRPADSAPDEAPIRITQDTPWYPPAAAAVLEALRGELDGVKFGVLQGRVAGVSTSQLLSVLKVLVAERRLAKVARDGGTRYRLPLAGEDLIPGPPVRSVPIPTFDAVALRQKIESLLASGASYDLHELVLSARSSQPHADKANVNAILEELVAAGKASILTLGVRVRYRKADEAAAS